MQNNLSIQYIIFTIKMASQVFDNFQEKKVFLAFFKKEDHRVIVLQDFLVFYGKIFWTLARRSSGLLHVWSIRYSLGKNN